VTEVFHFRIAIWTHSAVTHSLINAKNERYWVKFHFKTQQGIKNLTNAEADAIIAKDREKPSTRFV